MQNVIRKRERAREARLRSDGCLLFWDWSFSMVVGLILLSQNAAFEVFENHIMKEIPVGT